MATKYFTDDELACKSTGIVKLAPGFSSILDSLRAEWGKPMIVTSCCRSASYNKAVGGHPRSLHVYDAPFHPTGGTAAIDIAVAGASEAWRLAYLAMQLGWSVGVPRAGFLHLDRRTDFGLAKGIFGY